MPRTALDSIGRLPEHARDEVSRAIADGRTAKQIAKICEGHGLKGVQAQNVTNYKHGRKHKEWTAKQERMAVIRREQSESRDIFDAAIADGMNPADAACLLASRKILAAIEGIDMEVIHGVAEEDPRIYIEVIKAATALSKALKPSGKAQPAREAAAQDAPKVGGLSAEEKTHRMKEFFGAA
jgi:hypothetical protein